MINKMKLALAGAVIATGMVSNAAYAATEQAQATVDVLTAVAITVDSGLNFGVVAASATGGTVSVAASAVALPVGAGVVPISGGNAGAFRVTQGTNNAVLDLTASNPTPLTSGANQIVLSGLTLSANSITFNSASITPVYVGGMISLGANQPAGTYTGTFDVTAEYQ